MLLTRPLQSTRRLTSAQVGCKRHCDCGPLWAYRPTASLQSQDDGGPGILALGLSPLALSAGPLSSKDPAARSEGFPRSSELARW